VAWFTKKKAKAAVSGDKSRGNKSKGQSVQPRPSTPVPTSGKPTIAVEIGAADIARSAVGGNVIVPKEDLRRPGRPISTFNENAELLYVRHYVKTLKAMGAPHFQAYYSNPFLVGIGLLADLSGGNREGARMTKAVQLDCVETAADGTPGSAGRVWSLRPNPVFATPTVVAVGRAQNNDVVVPEFAISQRHCQFDFIDRKIMVSDIGSLNGTHVNGRRLENEASMEIRNLDVLILGRFQFQFFSASGFLTEVSDRVSMEE
jgi:hypothetical protein